jgi:hypothetical protein
LSEQCDTAFDRIKHDCATTIFELRCPRHFKDATVEIEIGRPNILYIDIVTCCEEFEKQAREALLVNLGAAREEFLYEMENGGQPENRVHSWVAPSSQGPDRKPLAGVVSLDCQGTGIDPGPSPRG